LNDTVNDVVVDQRAGSMVVVVDEAAVEAVTAPAWVVDVEEVVDVVEDFAIVVEDDTIVVEVVAEVKYQDVTTPPETRNNSRTRAAATKAAIQTRLPFASPDPANLDMQQYTEPLNKLPK